MLYSATAIAVYINKWTILTGKIFSVFTCRIRGCSIEYSDLVGYLHFKTKL
jgi:hypothetical protein